MEQMQILLAILVLLPFVSALLLALCAATVCAGLSSMAAPAC